MNVVANHVVPISQIKEEPFFEQLDMFTDYEEERKKRETVAKALEKEKRLQQAMLDIKQKYGKNAILHGSSYREEATGRERNEQVGGHRA